MGGRSGSPERNDGPGPGQYEANESMIKYKSPSYKITHGSQRVSMVSKEQMTLPGPGNYAHLREFGQDAKAFSMRGRPQEKVGNEVPGPGNYDGNLDVVKDKVRSYKMGGG